MSDVRPHIPDYDDELQMSPLDANYSALVHADEVPSFTVDNGVDEDGSLPPFIPLAAPSGAHKFPALDDHRTHYVHAPKKAAVAPARPGLVSTLFHQKDAVLARVEANLKPKKVSKHKQIAGHHHSKQPKVSHEREQEELNRRVVAEVQGTPLQNQGPLTEWQAQHYAEAKATAEMAAKLSQWWTETAKPVVSQVAQSLGVGSLFAEPVAEKTQKRRPRAQHVEAASSPISSPGHEASALEVVEAVIEAPQVSQDPQPLAVTVLETAPLPSAAPAPNVEVAPEAIVVESHSAPEGSPAAVVPQAQTVMPAVSSGDSESESVTGFSGSLKTAQTASDAELPLVQVAAVQTTGVAEAGVNISSNLNVLNGTGNGRPVSPEISAPVVSQVSDPASPQVVAVASGNQNTVKTRGSASNEVLISSSVSTRRPAQVAQAQRSDDSSAQAPVVVHLQSGTSVAEAQGYQNARTVDPQTMAAQVSVSQMAAVEHSHGDIVASDSNSSRLAGKLAQTLNTVAAGQDSSKGRNSGDDRGRDRNQENAIAMKDDIGELSQPEWVDDEGYASLEDLSFSELASSSLYVPA